MTLGAQKFIDVNGFDLVNVFEPWLAGDPTAANTGLQNTAGQDLSAVFAPLSVGTAIGYNTLFQTPAGLDLAAIFAKKGSRAGAALTATIPATANAHTLVAGGSATTTVTGVAAGGSGTGYTYLWSIVSGLATIADPTVNPAAFTETPPSGGLIQSTVHAVVTDSLGATATSNDCAITFSDVQGPAGSCVSANAAVLMDAGGYCLASDLRLDDVLAAWMAGHRTEGRAVLNNPDIHLVPTMRVEAAGSVLVCSQTTPFDVFDDDSESVVGLEVDGHRVLTPSGWATCVARPEARAGYVSHISLGGYSFAAGTVERGWIVSHNVIRLK